MFFSMGFDPELRNIGIRAESNLEQLSTTLRRWDGVGWVGMGGKSGGSGTGVGGG